MIPAGGGRVNLGKAMEVAPSRPQENPAQWKNNAKSFVGLGKKTLK